MELALEFVQKGDHSSCSCTKYSRLLVDCSCTKNVVVAVAATQIGQSSIGYSCIKESFISSWFFAFDVVPWLLMTMVILLLLVWLPYHFKPNKIELELYGGKLKRIAFLIEIIKESSGVNIISIINE